MDRNKIIGVDGREHDLSAARDGSQALTVALTLVSATVSGLAPGADDGFELRLSRGIALRDEFSAEIALCPADPRSGRLRSTGVWLSRHAHCPVLITPHDDRSDSSLASVTSFYRA
jgi:hypothetical protein